MVQSWVGELQNIWRHPSLFLSHQLSVIGVCHGIFLVYFVLVVNNTNLNAGISNKLMQVSDDFVFGIYHSREAFNYPRITGECLCWMSCERWRSFMWRNASNAIRFVIEHRKILADSKEDVPRHAKYRPQVLDHFLIGRSVVNHLRKSQISDWLDWKWDLETPNFSNPLQ